MKIQVAQTVSKTMQDIVVAEIELMHKGGPEWHELESQPIPSFTASAVPDPVKTFKDDFVKKWQKVAKINGCTFKNSIE